MQSVQKHVAALRVFAGRFLRAVFQQQVARQPKLRGTGCCLTGMVRLRSALRQHHVSPHRLRFSQQELQFAGLVATARHAGAVVTLHPDFRTTKHPGEIRQMLQRRGQVGETDARETGKVHGATGRPKQVPSLRRFRRSAQSASALVFYPRIARSTATAISCGGAPGRKVRSTSPLGDTK